MRALKTYVLLATLSLAGCGGSSIQSTLPSGSRGDQAVREQCEGGQVEAIDLDADGTPEVRHVRDGGRRRCTQYDLNHDGKVDVVRFYASDGRTAVREEHDFDFDGILDQIAFFEAGELRRKELDTNFDRAIDTWMWCEGGLVVRAERDRRYRGKADTWERYENGSLVAARYDQNNDGQADRWETFSAGRLVKIAYDMDGDGKPDRREPVDTANAGPPDTPIRCDVSALPSTASEPSEENAEQGSSESGSATDETPTTPQGASSEEP